MPVIALVDTNCDPDEADFVIPGNDDAIRSCSLVIHALGNAIAEGQQRAKPADFAPAPAEETQPEPGPEAEPAAAAEPEAEPEPVPVAEAAPEPEPVPVPDAPEGAS
jgi:small subunit ribosomal protein S2